MTDIDTHPASFPEFPAALPYAGTAGYSGSDTSREMARREADDGTVADRQHQAVLLLQAAGPTGMTVKEFRERTGHHHGKASSTLSTLHEGGHVARLRGVRRDRCEVYVLPRYVLDRETAPHGRRDPVDEALQEWLAVDQAGWSKAGRFPLEFVRAMRAVTGYGA